MYSTLEDFINNDEVIRVITLPLHNFDSDANCLDFSNGISALLITPELYESLYLRGGTFRSEHNTEHRGLRKWLLKVQVTNKKLSETEAHLLLLMKQNAELHTDSPKTS